jgi:PAS domain S-box-containing protein
MSANEEMYRQIVKGVPEGIWVVNPQGRTIFCNERMAEILGTGVDSLQRLSCFDPVFPADLEEAQRQFGLQMAGGGRPFDLRLGCIDGSALWASISCMPMYDASGVSIGLLCLFTDIGERRRADGQTAMVSSENSWRAEDAGHHNIGADRLADSTICSAPVSGVEDVSPQSPWTDCIG